MRVQGGCVYRDGEDTCYACGAPWEDEEVTVKKGKRKVNRLFDLQTVGGFHLEWCSDEKEVKEFINNSPCTTTVVYQKIGTFEVPVVRPIWKKLVR